jgi:tungstate transport system ATP-binding protein
MTNDSLNILEVRNIKIKRAGALLVDIPFLQIERGELLSLIGPNGAGKTTLLLALAGLMKPTTGEISFRGQKIGFDYPVFEYRRNLAMVFQEPLLFNTTVLKNVASGLTIRGMEKKQIRQIVKESLERFGIGHLGERSARTLSGGEAQRTSLARAFAIHPEILFLDEPFAALDPPTREALIEDLQAVLQETHTTTIFATHDRAEALRLSDRIGVMNDGSILQIGAPEEVMNHPMNEFVANFVGVETILRGKVIRRDEGSFVTLVSDHEIEAVGDVKLGESVALCIRPENVTLSTVSRSEALRPQGGASGKGRYDYRVGFPPRLQGGASSRLAREPTSARNVFHGRITKITPLGFFQRIQLDCGFLLVAYVTRHSVDELSLGEGKDVNASFKATAIHVVRKREK